MPSYPRLNIGSKNILYKRLDEKELVQDCIQNFDKFWRDNAGSIPEKDKWVRDCSGTRLSRLLSKIDRLLLKPLDNELPFFIHGGISGRFRKQSGAVIPKCTQSAAISLIDGKKGRWLLHMDLQRFFEQVSQERVVTLFSSKLGCSRDVAFLLSELCCIQEGSKKSHSSEDRGKVIARGFSPSVRLAVWCNLEFFLALNRLVQKRLRGHSPKLAIFVDDIGITATGMSRKELEKVKGEIISLAEQHKLIINPDKTKLVPPSEVKEYVGLHITNGKIFPSFATNRKRLSRTDDVKNFTGVEKEKAKRSLVGLQQNRKFTKKMSLA